MEKDNEEYEMCRKDLEENIQKLKKDWFLKEDNGTIFNDWDEQKSGLFYSGLIGGASALLMGALPTAVDINTA